MPSFGKHVGIQHVVMSAETLFVIIYSIHFAELYLAISHTGDGFTA